MTDMTSHIVYRNQAVYLCVHPGQHGLTLPWSVEFEGVEDAEINSLTDLAVFVTNSRSVELGSRQDSRICLVFILSNLWFNVSYGFSILSLLA